MNTWLSLAAVLVALSGLSSVGTGDPDPICNSRSARGDAPPIDFLFASAQDWKRLAHPDVLDARR